MFTLTIFEIDKCIGIKYKWKCSMEEVYINIKKEEEEELNWCVIWDRIFFASLVILCFLFLTQRYFLLKKNIPGLFIVHVIKWRQVCQLVANILLSVSSWLPNQYGIKGKKIKIRNCFMVDMKVTFTVLIFFLKESFNL